MKSRWKKLFLWSSIGSVTIGAAIALARRARAPRVPALDFILIPGDCQRIALWTEQFTGDAQEIPRAVQDKYFLQLTPFKVWSVFELNGSSEEKKPEGATVYHVTHIRYAEDSGGTGYPDEGRLQDRFYGTISVLDLDGVPGPKNHIARGGILQIRKCLVGGASNGVESGELHHSAAPILNYRFEYSAR
jgi:hypothetical protein